VSDELAAIVDRAFTDAGAIYDCDGPKTAILAAMSESRAIYARQDNCLIAIEHGRPLPIAALLALPPWRAVTMARIAAKAGVGLERGTLGQIEAEARAVLGSGKLGNWWERPETEV
jgi:hypothetical protein